MQRPSARHVLTDRTEHPGAEHRMPDPYARPLDERIVLLGTPIDDTSANVVTARFTHLEHRDPDRGISPSIDAPGAPGAR
ncbi:ATP-dependent Clp protease proteolytic subunit [Streptomyces sp. NPDC005386]|uniref:ATP-dependent Clp protease proteolytic subunit n=1 Tax=Streptomyces sp. NPDC005386 TaxID=3154562 RepID=UPI0033A890D1